MIRYRFCGIMLAVMLLLSLCFNSYRVAYAAVHKVDYHRMPFFVEGDTNLDNSVDGADFYNLLSAYGSSPGDSNWNAQVDFNEDQHSIDGSDMYVILSHWGEYQDFVAPVAYSSRLEFTVPNDGDEEVHYYVMAVLYVPSSLSGKEFNFHPSTVNGSVHNAKITYPSGYELGVDQLIAGYYLLEFEFYQTNGGGKLAFDVTAQTGEPAWLYRFRIYVPDYSVNKCEYSVKTTAWCFIKDDYFLIGRVDDFIDDVHVDGRVLENCRWNCSPYDTIYAWGDGFCYPMGNLARNVGLNAYQISFNFGETNTIGFLDFQYISWSKQTNRIGSPKFSLIAGQTPIYNNTISIAQDGGKLNVNGYYNSSSPPPECSAVGPSGEFADAPQTMPTGNSRYIRVAGYDYSSDSANAYCYFNLTYVNVKINATTMLSFWMWVYQTPQSNGHIFIDGKFTPALDGVSTLRDVIPNGTYLVDQFGERIHPGDHFAPWGSWQHYMLNLSRLCGSDRRLTYLMVAYDDGIEASGRGGNDQFRAYIDGVCIYDVQDQPSVTVNINVSGSPIPSGSFALVYSAYSNELVSNTNISGSCVLCKALWGKVNIYLCNADGVWWTSRDLQIQPNSWNTVTTNVGTHTPAPEARVQVTWVNMSDRTAHPVSGGQVTNYYSDGNTSVSTNDRGIANFTLSTSDMGQNYILAQYTAADGSVFTSNEEFVNATFDRFAVLNLAVSAPSISCTVIKSNDKYYELLFEVTSFNEEGQLKISTRCTPYANLGSNYGLSPHSTDINMFNGIVDFSTTYNGTALVSYWILNDTSNNRLVLYSHENITYAYNDLGGPHVNYSLRIWGPTLTHTQDYYNPSLYYPITEDYEPLVGTALGGIKDLLGIAVYGDGNAHPTFDGAYQLNDLTAINPTAPNEMKIVGLYVKGYAQIDSATNYLLDQGAAGLYQLCDAYKPEPDELEPQSFNSGNHTTGVDAINFSLHGHSCVYTSRVVDFSPSPYVGLASTFVCGSSDTAYYRNVSDVYLNASKWLLNNAANYPALSFYSFEQDADTQCMRSTLLKRQVCYQAALNQIANATMGAAINSTWHDSQNGGSPWDWSSWYDKIARPSFYDSSYSSLCIDNYEDSLYMQTVQGYIQGLFEGSIDHNCTFILITIDPLKIVVCPNGNINYTATISYVDNRGVTQNIRRTYNVLPQFKLLLVDSAFWSGSAPYNPSQSLHIVSKVLTPLKWFAWFGAHVQVAKPIIAYSGEGFAQISLETYMYFPHISLFKSFPELSYMGKALFGVSAVIDIATQNWIGLGIDSLTYALAYSGNPYAIALALGISAGWALYQCLTAKGCSPILAGIASVAVGAAVFGGLLILAFYLVWIVIVI